MCAIATPVRGASLDESVFSGFAPLPAELRGTAETSRWSAGHAHRVLAERPASGYMQEQVSFYSPAKEAGYSMLLPGLGHYRMGYTTRGKIFFGLEGLTWLAVGTFLWQGYTQEKEYKDYAVSYAAVMGTDHPENYWEAVGSYRSSDGPGGYNEAMRREARDLYYPDVAQMDAYYEQHMISGDLAWAWQSERDYDRYNDIRHGSTQANRRALYGVVFALTMRLVSSIDAVRLAKKENNRAREAGGDISLRFEERPRGLAVSLVRSF
jgi:hypothetical protein